MSSNFHPLVVVSRGSETQLQEVGKYVKKTTIGKTRNNFKGSFNNYVALRGEGGLGMLYGA